MKKTYEIFTCEVFATRSPEMYSLFRFLNAVNSGELVSNFSRQLSLCNNNS